MLNNQIGMVDLVSPIRTTRADRKGAQQTEMTNRWESRTRKYNPGEKA